MNVIRLFVPDLGDNVFKSLGAMDHTTVQEVKNNLANKLVGLSTISEIDLAKFAIYEVKDGKEEKLDDGKLIMAVVKKWPKKGNTPTLVFKSGDVKNKLQTIQHENVSSTTIPPKSPTIQPVSPKITPQQPIKEEPPMATTIMPMSKITTSPSPSSNNLNPSFSNKTINNIKKINSSSDVFSSSASPISGDSVDEAMLILNNFEKQWKSGKIQTSHEILTALLGG